MAVTDARGFSRFMPHSVFGLGSVFNRRDQDYWLISSSEVRDRVSKDNRS